MCGVNVYDPRRVCVRGGESNSINLSSGSSYGLRACDVRGGWWQSDVVYIRCVIHMWSEWVNIYIYVWVSVLVSHTNRRRRRRRVLRKLTDGKLWAINVILLLARRELSMAENFAQAHCGRAGCVFHRIFLYMRESFPIIRIYLLCEGI